MVSLSELGWGYVALLVLFAGIFVALLAYLARSPAKAGAASAPPPTPATSGTLAAAMAAPGAVAEPYLLRFVRDETGERVGETLSMTPDRVIVKRDGRFYALPLTAVSLQEGDLVARGVDWTQAEREGEAWRAAQQAQHEALEFDAHRE